VVCRDVQEPKHIISHKHWLARGVVPWPYPLDAPVLTIDLLFGACCVSPLFGIWMPLRPVAFDRTLRLRLGELDGAEWS